MLSRRSGGNAFFSAASALSRFLLLSSSTQASAASTKTSTSASTTQPSAVPTLIITLPVSVIVTPMLPSTVRNTGMTLRISTSRISTIITASTSGYVTALRTA